jgi:hypothetical protein
VGVAVSATATDAGVQVGESSGAKSGDSTLANSSGDATEARVGAGDESQATNSTNKNEHKNKPVTPGQLWITFFFPGKRLPPSKMVGKLASCPTTPRFHSSLQRK